MWICLLVNRKLLELRSGGANRGTWGIIFGKVGERSVLIFRALKVVAPACLN
jgi:hypothetical protein